MSKMKLCKVCQKEVAKSAKVCPNCGAKLKMGLLKKIGIGIGSIIVLCVIISALGNSKDTSSQTSSQTSSTQKQSKPTWNTTESNAQKNGNASVAVDLIKSNSDLKSKATAPEASQVAKVPWNYYGQVVKITGTIDDIQEYPAGSDWSKELGGKEAGQIVVSSDDGAVTDMLLMGSTGNLQDGDYVSIYGYPIGVSDVDNKLGGKTTQLFIVGNAYDKN